MITESERRMILGFVRGVISAACGGTREPEAPELPRLAEKGACFVTLREAGKARGCIGSVEAFESLADNLRRNAENAAFSDPAFPPLEADELGLVTLEVSIISPPRRIFASEELSLGSDGVLFVNGTRRAVFLPQVAIEQRWSAAELLENVAHKAGVSSGEWRTADAELYAFGCETFSE